MYISALTTTDKSLKIRDYMEGVDKNWFYELTVSKDKISFYLSFGSKEIEDRYLFKHIEQLFRQFNVILLESNFSDWSDHISMKFLDLDGKKEP